MYFQPTLLLVFTASVVHCISLDPYTQDDNHVGISKRQTSQTSDPTALWDTFEQAPWAKDFLGPDSGNPMIEGMFQGLENTSAFNKSISSSDLKIPGAKHLTLWYQGPTFPEQKVNKNQEQTGLTGEQLYAGFLSGPPGRLPESNEKGTMFMRRLRDFPGNITIYKAKLSLCNEDGTPVNVTNGVYIIDAALHQPTVQSFPIMNCPSGLRNVPINMERHPHRWASYGSDSVSFFSPLDGSRPKMGMSVKQEGEMVLYVAGINLSSERARQTAIKLEIDYAEGKPERRVLTRQMILWGNCDRFSMQRLSAGSKQWVFRTKPAEYSSTDSDVVSTSKFIVILESKN
jgi:hypothetical protein